MISIDFIVILVTWIFNRFGVPSGYPRGALWGTFSVLVATPRAQEPKKRRIARCLFAGSIFDRIFFTFRVPWIPKNSDSVCERYTKPHFRPRPKKNTIFTDFVIVLQTICTMLETFGSPLGLEGACFSFLFRLDFSISFLMDFRPRRVPQKGTRRQGDVCSGAMVKRHILRKA